MARGSHVPGTAARAVWCLPLLLLGAVQLASVAAQDVGEAVAIPPVVGNGTTFRPSLGQIRYQCVPPAWSPGGAACARCTVSGARACVRESGCARVRRVPLCACCTRRSHV